MTFTHRRHIATRWHSFNRHCGYAAYLMIAVIFTILASVVAR